MDCDPKKPPVVTTAVWNFWSRYADLSGVPACYHGMIQRAFLAGWKVGEASARLRLGSDR